MVERVAKAAHDKLFTDCINRSDWPTTNCSINANGFRDAARAAIAAMREPTEGQIEAGMRAIDYLQPESRRVVASDVWRAMIEVWS